jgi:hypothetical protein
MFDSAGWRCGAQDHENSGYPEEFFRTHDHFEETVDPQIASPALFLMGFSERNRLPKEGKKHTVTVDTENAIHSIS